MERKILPKFERRQSSTDPAENFAIRGSRSERRERGKNARKAVPLKLQDSLPATSSSRDLLSILRESNKGRIEKLIPIRHGRMLQSPFTFYRGSAALMAADLSCTPVSGLIAQCCGDCHIQNFGAFATQERNVIIDINDFDETLPAPWEWDVKRLATSLLLAAQAAGFSSELGVESAFNTVRQYRKYMAELAQMRRVEMWYSRLDYHEFVEKIQDPQRREASKMNLKEAERKSSIEYLMQKYTEDIDGHPRFKELPPLIYHSSFKQTEDAIRKDFNAYLSTLSDDRRVLLQPYKVVDVAIKVVGIGSVGTHCGIALLAADENDLMILQIKEATSSVLEPYAGKSKYVHHGQRVVNGQKLMQAASDMFLGWYTTEKLQRQYFVRQLRDVKISVDTSTWAKSSFRTVAPVAGKVLARAHARSGDALAISAYMGKTDEFENAIATFAKQYAKLVQRDYDKYVYACKTGALKYEMGPA